MIEQLFPGGGGGADELAKVSSNDTTAGYLNGKLVAGTGITFTENNNGSNETLGIAIGNHDASLITTGTVATARLGTGTANSSTYLAGDQTYKTAVTSVNGSTGAVTVAAGDTTYSMTVVDVENTGTKLDAISFVVPANTWSNGEIVTLEFWYLLNNTSGTQRNFVVEQNVAGTVLDYSSVSVPGSVTRYGLARYKFWRNGSTISMYTDSRFISYNRDWTAAEFLRPDYIYDVTTSNAYDLRDHSTVTPSSFASNITIKITGQWSFGNAAQYLRILNARAYKLAGQQT